MQSSFLPFNGSISFNTIFSSPPRLFGFQWRFSALLSSHRYAKGLRAQSIQSLPHPEIVTNTTRCGHFVVKLHVIIDRDSKE
jgi:hypothetical protein